MNKQISSLTPFFNPQGIAVIGASTNPDKLGYGLARNLVQSKYQGVLHYVNPKGGKLLGRPLYASILEVPDPVDLAILLIPAKAVPQALLQCGERGLPAAIISSGGFRETGPEGAALEAECLQIAQAHQMRLLGPNCIGLLDTHLPVDATFLPPPGPLPGDVAFISHSGAICAAVIDWARGQGFGLSKLVSLGNQADINETDVLKPVAADPHTRVLCLYLESVSDGRKFVSVASQVSPKKPIIALKVGRYASGQRAVASHTGALAGEDNAFNAAFHRAGVIRADTSEEMFDWARALAWCQLPRGRTVAVLTNAGGPGVNAVDAVESNGLKVAELKDETQAALGKHLPRAASLLNPVDMLASATPGQYAESLRILLSDPGVDSVLVILPPPPMFSSSAVASALIPVIHKTDKPVVITLMGESLIQETAAQFRAARIPEYRFPERAASALAILAQRAESLSSLPSKAQPGYQVDTDAVRAVFHEYKPDFEQASLSQEVSHQILAAYGIHTPPIGLARSPEEAQQLAEKFGYPVALKVASPDIIHKSDLGGVILDQRNSQAVAESYIRITRNIQSARPDARITGVHVQRMFPKGQEVIIGGLQDPLFGPLVMFGSGGVEVEGLKDVAFALAPLPLEEAERLLDKTWAGRKLDGYRNLPPADRGAVLDVLMRLAQLVADQPELEEIEINPLLVLPQGEGAYALDVRGRYA